MSTRPHNLPDEDDDIQSVHDDEPMVNSKDELAPQSPYSLQSMDLFPEPYHDEPLGKSRLQRNFSRSEAGSVRSNIARQSSAANRPRGSVLHEADEDLASRTDFDSQKPQLPSDLPPFHGELDDKPEKLPSSRSPLPVLPAVEPVDAIKLPSRFNSTVSTSSHSQDARSPAPIFPPTSRPAPSERLPPLPTPLSHALHRASASQLTRNTSQLSRAPTIPRRSSKRNSSVPILGVSRREASARPFTPVSAQTRLPGQISVSEGSGRNSPKHLSTGQVKMPSATRAHPDLSYDNSEQTRFPFLNTTSIDRSKSTSDRSEGGLTTDSMGSSTAGPLKHCATAAAAAAAAAVAESQVPDNHSQNSSQPYLPREGPSSLATVYPDEDADAEAHYRGTGAVSLHHSRPQSQAISSKPSSPSINPPTSSLKISDLSHVQPRPFSASPASTANPSTSDPYSYLNQVTESNHGEVLHHRAGDGYVLSHPHVESVDLAGNRAEVISPSDVSMRTQTSSDRMER
ncbi:hypothetical protein KEM54_000495 [Ascosphaera aggregata]|nr:hypothetical protein KEM54_000495 [Ascosphaera aggregata]